ncbi:MAG: SHOCT domain-containing protein [Flavobacteriia bacterium]|nr:SHOCT domain-containing protein [Flavobacteriia bacterium]
MKSVVDRIKVLVELRDSGSISKAEFDQMLALLEEEIKKETVRTESPVQPVTKNNTLLSIGRKKLVILGSIILLITSVLSYFTMVPAFLWDGDGDGFHTYRTDNCPEKSGKTCMGCPDTDNDGIADSEDTCPNLFGNKSAKGCPDADGDNVKDADDRCSSVRGTVACNGCPDTDGDYVADAIDKCPQVFGPVSNDGCAEDVVKGSVEEIEKLTAKKAIKVPSDFGNYIITDKWLKFIDGHYEYSNFEKREYKDVVNQETVDKLNDYYGLHGSPKKEGGDNGGSGPVVQDPPKIKSNLTPAEQAELNFLLKKATTEPLSVIEKRRMMTLEKKSDGF